MDPIQIQVDRGATVLINISASPFQVGKDEVRYRLLRPHAQKHRLPFVYVNQTGGNDELIFDGRSLAFDPYFSGISRYHSPASRACMPLRPPSPQCMLP